MDVFFMKPGLLVIQRRSPELLEALSRDYTVHDYGRADDKVGVVVVNYWVPFSLSRKVESIRTAEKALGKSCGARPYFSR